MERDTWKSNWGFLLATIGSAVGLGNIWRFSYVCHKNGGGTFLIPYVIALLTCGIPLMILEFAIGHKMRASAPASMHQVDRKWEWLGWWPVIFVMFGINLYYTVVIAWCGRFMLFSLEPLMGRMFPWQVAEGTQDFFYDSFLGLSGEVFELGKVSWWTLAMTLLVWGLLWFICVRRVEKGIEAACKVFMPVLLLLTTILVLWSLTLEGAWTGIREYLRPDFSRLGEVQVWRDAFGQIFFTLSIGFGIMIAYASYLPRKTNLVRSAFIISLVDSGYSIFAGFAVFGVLGYMAHAKGIALTDVIAAGPGLCFKVYPEAISLLPGGAKVQALFGFFFFLTLLLAGVTSAMSIIEAFAAAAIDKFKWNRSHVVTLTCLIGFAGSIVFTTGAGYLWLDIVDHFLNSYGLVVVGLLECILISWYYKLERLHFHMYDANQGAYPKLWDIWWEWTVMFVSPVVLAIILMWSLKDELSAPYENYPANALALIGWGWVLATFLVSGYFSVYTRHKDRPVHTLGGE